MSSDWQRPRFTVNLFTNPGPLQCGFDPGKATSVPLHAPSDSLNQLFHIIQFLQGGDGQHVAIVLLEIDLELFTQPHQFTGVLERLRVVSLQDLLFLGSAVGQSRLPIRAAGRLPGGVQQSGESRAEDGCAH